MIDTHLLKDYLAIKKERSELILRTHELQKQSDLLAEQILHQAGESGLDFVAFDGHLFEMDFEDDSVRTYPPKDFAVISEDSNESH